MRSVPSLAALTAALVLAPLALGSPGSAAVARPVAVIPKVLLIGIDGMVADRVADAEAPVLQAMQDTGTDARSLLYAEPMAATSSGPGWTTMLTGTWPDKHGVVDNTFDGSQVRHYPSWMTRLEQVRPELDTFAAVDWAPLAYEILRGGPDQTVRIDGEALGYREADRRLAERTADHLRGDTADATFVYFGQLDVVGHAHGSASPQYVAEIGRMDGYVRQLLDAIDERASRTDERWLVLVSTDHGHLASGGHGGSSLIERGTFVLASGDGVPTAHPATTRLVDVAASALDHLGVRPRAGWGLDGRSVLARDHDHFERLADHLRPARTEDVDPEILGYTHRLPRGWHQDRSALAVRGVPEWRGWTLTTDAFWSSVAPDQSRETFVRGRGVFAVADSDEWADTDGSAEARFDATLWTAPVDVTASGELEVALTQWYRHDANSQAQVLLAVDGESPMVAITYRSSTPAGPDVLRLDLPAGAQRASVGFRLEGTNSWYWAVDDVHLRPVE